MATYTTTEVRSRIAGEIWYWYKIKRGSWHPIVRADYETRIGALRMLAMLHFRKEVKAETTEEWAKRLAERMSA
jgi:hypothetical protein